MSDHDSSGAHPALPHRPHGQPPAGPMYLVGGSATPQMLRLVAEHPELRAYLERRFAEERELGRAEGRALAVDAIHAGPVGVPPTFVAARRQGDPVAEITVAGTVVLVAFTTADPKPPDAEAEIAEWAALKGVFDAASADARSRPAATEHYLPSQHLPPGVQVALWRQGEACVAVTRPPCPQGLLAAVRRRARARSIWGITAPLGFLGDLGPRLSAIYGGATTSVASVAAAAVVTSTAVSPGAHHQPPAPPFREYHAADYLGRDHQRRLTVPPPASSKPGPPADPKVDPRANPKSDPVPGPGGGEGSTTATNPAAPVVAPAAAPPNSPAPITSKPAGPGGRARPPHPSHPQSPDPAAPTPDDQPTTAIAPPPAESAPVPAPAQAEQTGDPAKQRPRRRPKRNPSQQLPPESPPPSD